jgi:hypothetical protein
MKVEFKSGRELRVFRCSISLSTEHPSQIKTESIFSTYLIQSNASNEITVSLATSALLSVLKSASSLTSVEKDETIVKLSKKSGQAVLNFETHAINSVGRRMSVGHDVRIEIMRPKDVQKLCEPLCPEPEVCLFNSGCNSHNFSCLPFVGSHSPPTPPQNAHHCRPAEADV